MLSGFSERARAAAAANPVCGFVLVAGPDLQQAKARVFWQRLQPRASTVGWC
jgi:hypothetical protein